MSNTVTALRPASFERYIAVSASWISVAASSTSAPNATAMPIDTEMNTSPASSRNAALEHPPDPIGEPGCTGCVEATGDDEELVARDPPDDVVAPHAVADPLGGEDEQLVADGMTHRVVDELELVEIEEHQRDRPTGSPRLAEHRVDVLDDQDAIRQAGEIVVVGLVRQPEAERGLLLHRSRQPHDRRHGEHEAQHRRHRTGRRHVVERDDHDRGEQRGRDREQPTATHRVDRPAGRPGEEPDRRVQDGRSDRRRHQQDTAPRAGAR